MVDGFCSGHKLNKMKFCEEQNLPQYKKFVVFCPNLGKGFVVFVSSFFVLPVLKVLEN